MAPSKKNKTKELPLIAFTADKIYIRRWTENSPTNSNYFYDNPVVDVTKKPTEYPV